MIEDMLRLLASERDDALAMLAARESQIEHLFRHSGRDGSEDYDALEVSAAWFRLRQPLVKGRDYE